MLTEREVIPAEISGTSARLTGFTQNGTTLTLTVDSAHESFNLTEILLINDDASATFTLGGSELAQGTLNLSYGQNTATLTVRRAGFEESVYTVSIYRTPVYTVSFNSKGGSSVAAISVKEGQKAIEPIAPTKAGYEFAGWYAGDELYDFEAAVTGDITLIAEWTAVEYTITYYFNGNKITHTPTTFTIESNTIALTPYAPEGYTFDGWYLDEALTESVTEIATGSTGNRTFYLKLIENVVESKYTITYNLNGGTNAEGNPTEYVVGDTTVLKAPTKEGHTFAGWYTDPYFKNGIATLNGKTGDLVLYAKWVQTGSSGILTPEDKFD